MSTDEVMQKLCEAHAVKWGDEYVWLDRRTALVIAAILQARDALSPQEGKK